MKRHNLLDMHLDVNVLISSGISGDGMIGKSNHQFLPSLYLKKHTSCLYTFLLNSPINTSYKPISYRDILHL